MPREPIANRIHIPNFICTGAIPAISPALHLSFQKTLGPSESGEVAVGHIDRVQPNLTVNEGFTDQARVIACSTP